MVILQQSLKKWVSHKLMGATMTLDMLKHPSPVVLKPRNVFNGGWTFGPELCPITHCSIRGLKYMSCPEITHLVKFGRRQLRFDTKR